MGKFRVFFPFLMVCAHGWLDPTGENVCLVKESYDVPQEFWEEVPVTAPSKKWCWSVTDLFKCKTRRTYMDRRLVQKVVTKTKLVAKCCEGYREDRSHCVPVCHVQCGFGYCVAPDTCSCPAGFHGPFCGIPCPNNLWGENCKEKCFCLHEGVCDGVTGACTCKPGWEGNWCDIETVYTTTTKSTPATTTELKEIEFNQEDINRLGRSGVKEEETTTEVKKVEANHESINKLGTNGDKEEETTIEARKGDLNHEDINKLGRNEAKEEETTTKTKKVESTHENINRLGRNDTKEEQETKTEPKEIITEEKIMKEFRNLDSNQVGSNIRETTTETKEIKKKFGNEYNNGTVDNMESASISQVESAHFEKEFVPSTETSTTEIRETTEIDEIPEAKTNLIDSDETKEPTPAYTDTEITIEIVSPEIMILINQPKDINWENGNEIEIESGSVSEQQKKSARLIYFIPSLTVLSGVSLLILLIAGRWWIVRHKKALKKIQVEKEEKYHAEWQRKDSRDDGLFANNFGVNSSHIPEIDIQVSVPVLQTFKPLDSGNKKEPQNTFNCS